MTKKLTSFALLALLLATSACNTMEGVGKDMQQGGKNLEKSADQHK